MSEDRFANIATLELTLSGANTLTFQELRTNTGIDADRKSATALLIDEIDYFVGTAVLAEMTASGDVIVGGLTISNAVTDLTDFTDRRILDTFLYQRGDLGTAASGWMHTFPLRHQWFPPMIVGERSVFLGMVTTGLASAAVLRCRIYYRVVTLTQGEFIEIAEVFRLVG